ncbi:CpsD/CapB family tyrosine-protein kinase [soil metagenome]
MSAETKYEAQARTFLASYSPLRAHFDTLASRLISRAGLPSTVVVTGPEPDTGCSSVCLGIGSAVAGMGHSAAIIDCNLDRPNLHTLLSEPNFVGLTSGLESDRPLESQGFAPVSDLLVVPTGPVPLDPFSHIRSERFVEAVRELQSSREIILLDAPIASSLLQYPTLCEDFDGVLFVVHASRTLKSAARAATDDLLEAGVNLLGVVLNGCP